MKRLLLGLLFAGTYASNAQPLYLDNMYGSNGSAINQVAGWNKIAHDIVQQQDGKIIAVGTEYEMNNDMYYFSLISRFRPNGEIDSSFGTNGSVRLVTGNKNAVEAVAIDATGKIYLAGNEYLVQGSAPNVQFVTLPFVAKLNADGTKDNSFGTAGVSKLQLPSMYGEQSLAAIAVLPNNKILVGGTVGASELRMVLVSLNIDGSYNNSFGNAGVGQYTMEANSNSSLWDMAIQTDGKILIAGTSESATLADPGNRVFAMARILSNGMIDNSFGVQGKVLTKVSPNSSFVEDMAHKVLVQPDGKICLAGTSSNALAIARYLIDGSSDLSFGMNGHIRHQQHPSATGFVSHNGKLYTCGSIQSDSGSLDITISAFNDNGSPDLTLAPDGMLVTNVYNRNYTHSMLVQGDGKIVTAGSFSDYDNHTGLLLTRFTLNNPTGLKNKTEHDIEVQVYPNPVNDHLTLSFTNLSLTAPVNIEIVSPSGITVLNTKMNGEKIVIPVSHLVQGIYLLRIYNEFGTKTLKFVKR